MKKRVTLGLGWFRCGRTTAIDWRVRRWATTGAGRFLWKSLKNHEKGVAGALATGGYLEASRRYPEARSTFMPRER